MDEKIKTKNEFLDKTKKKYEKLDEYKGLPKAKDIKVEGLLNDMNNFPGRISMVNTVGSTSVLPDKKDHNPLHGKDGKIMSGAKEGNTGKEELGD